MDLPNRKSIRIPGFQYKSANYYFITICTDRRVNLFGMKDQLTGSGQIAKSCLLQIPTHFHNVRIDQYVIMPNHIHAIVAIGPNNTCSLSTIIGQFKATVSKQIHAYYPNVSVWQRSFYDRIIRNDREYQEIWTYIDENPLKWKLDKLYRP